MVNTFITSSSLQECAENLDYKRLGKQRVEAYQLINVIEAMEQGKTLKIGWKNHPATKMWVGHLIPLKIYFNHMVREWVKRGYTNTMALYDVNEEEYKIIPSKFNGKKAIYKGQFNEKTFPWWFTFEPLVMSHKASLYRKYPEYYEKFNDAKLKPYLTKGYVWPHLGEEMRHNWNDTYFAEIGTGAPAHFRISKEKALEWAEKKTINPETGRKISEDSPTYKLYAKALAHYESLE